MKKTDLKKFLLIRTIRMEHLLLKEKATGNYFLISSSGRGCSFSIALQLGSFNKRIISNDYLDSEDNFVSLTLNSEAIGLIFKSFGVSSDLINVDDFDNYNYVRFKGQIVRIGNWNDFANFIATLI